MNSKNTKCLIAYFSREGNNYAGGKIVNLPVGNTQVAAEMIADLTGGDLFRIKAVHAYPMDYTETTEAAQRELQSGARPKLAAHLENAGPYDVIFLGYPNWWGTMPMPVFTFLEECDLSGKTIAPFCTHEGSGLGRSKNDIEKACPQAKILKGLAIRGSDVGDAKKDFVKWLDHIDKMI